VSGFYEDLRDTAAEMLAEFGFSATLRSAGTPAYSAATSAATSVTTASAVSCVLLDYPAKFVDGSLIRQGDRLAYVSAKGAAPKAGDTLVCGGTSLTVVSCKPVAPALLAVLYELQVRSA
jgi:hypothetical protein